MSRVRLILQGFVDLNLETNENINTQISAKDLGLVNKSSFLKKEYCPPNELISKEFELILKELNIDINSVLEIREENQSKFTLSHDNIKNINIVLYEDFETSISKLTVNEENYRVCVYSKKTMDSLILECDQIAINLYYNSDTDSKYVKTKDAPKFNLNKLIEKVRFDSDALWDKGEESIKNKESDFMYFFWKSIEILYFAEQILERGEIYDVDSYGYLFNNMIDSQQSDFSYFNENMSPTRDLIKLRLNMFIDDSNEYFMDLKP